MNSNEENEKIRNEVARVAREMSLHSARDGLANGGVWLLTFTYFFFAMGLYGLSFWLPSFISETGVRDPLNVGLLTAITYLGAPIAMYLTPVSR